MRPDRTAVWIPPDKRESTIKGIAETKRQFDTYDGGCLFVVDAEGQPCRKPVKNLCHTIPHGPVLTPMTDGKTGKVLEIMWGFGEFADLFMRGSEADPIDLSAPERYQPSSIGTGAASCGRFACKNIPNSDHDGVFRPIDVANPDFTDPLIAFLVHYRAHLWALFQLKRVDWLMKTWGRRQMRDGDWRLRALFTKGNEQLRTLLPVIQDKVTRLGSVWYGRGRSANFANNIVSGQQYCFQSKLNFAACVLYGWSSVASVFPAGGDLHQMGITSFVEDTQKDAEFTDELIEVATTSMKKDYYGVDMIISFRSMSSGVIVMSPDSYDKLSEDESNVINQWIQEFAQAETMAKNINSMLRERQDNRRR